MFTSVKQTWENYLYRVFIENRAKIFYPNNAFFYKWISKVYSIKDHSSKTS